MVPRRRKRWPRRASRLQQARGDEILNLISRSGDASFVQNFQAVRRELGPGPGTLLSTAAAASQGGPGAGPAAAAVHDAGPWYAANEQVYRLDVAASYAAETRLVIGTGPGSSAAGFQRLERDLEPGGGGGPGHVPVGGDRRSGRVRRAGGRDHRGVAADGGGLRVGHQPAACGVPVSGPAVTALTREQAEPAVSAAAAQRDTIQANLLDLDASFGKRLLAGASLDGETRRRWDTAVATLTRLFETFTAYSAVVDQAAELLPRARKSAAALADLAVLLTGASVQLPMATSALASRDLTWTWTAAVTLAAAVGEMRRGFAGVAELVATVERVERAGLPVQDLADQLAAARQQAAASPTPRWTRRPARPRRAWPSCAACSTATRWPWCPRWAAAAGRWTRRGWACCASRCPRSPPGPLSWPGLRACMDTRIAAAGAAVAAARAAWQDAMAARARVEAKIVADLPPLPGVGGLARQAAALDGLRAAGRWTRLATELDALDKLAADLIEQCQGAERDALALLDRRDELRGLLDAYRARAALAGAVEDSALEARYSQAQELLWTAPCDLPSATAAVTGYQQAVRALGWADRRAGRRR